MALLNFVVIRDYNGKPIRNASVVMHPVEKNGKQSRGGLQLKTDAEGKASFDGVPYGKLRIQVLAQGFQTFGDDYAIEKPTVEITVKMKRPQGQYSIYEDHPEQKKDEPGSGEAAAGEGFEGQTAVERCRFEIVDFRFRTSGFQSEI